MIEAMEKHAIQDGKKGASAADAEEEAGSDPMFKQAVEVVIDAGQASTSLLQRRCKLGYARAARIMDEMEQKGIIGPYEGAKPRAVLISRQQWLEMQMNQPEAIENYVDADLLEKFEFRNYGHASEILHDAFPTEWSELQECLRKLRLTVADIKRQAATNPLFLRNLMKYFIHSVGVKSESAEI